MMTHCTAQVTNPSKTVTQNLNSDDTVPQIQSNSFQLGTSSMNSKLTGEGAAADDDDDVKKNHFGYYKNQFLAINSDF